jgi:AcrR family transcriptional regulator
MNTSLAKRSRGRPKKTEEQRDDGNRRQALICAAAQLFKLKGYDATTTREIAAQIGMQPGSPFYHFENKQDLLLAVMVDGMKRAIADQHTLLNALLTQSPKANASIKLRILIRHHFEVLLGPQSDFIPVMLYEGRALNSVQRLTINKLKDSYEAAWIPVLQELCRCNKLRAPVGISRLMIFGALNWSVQWYEAPLIKNKNRAKSHHASLDELTEAALILFL